MKNAFFWPLTMIWNVFWASNNQISKFWHLLTVTVEGADLPLRSAWQWTDHFFKNLPSTIQTWNIEPTILHHHLSYWWEKTEIINLLCLKWSSTNCSVPILTTGDQSLRQSFDKQGRFFLYTFLMTLEDLSSLFQIFADHYISIYQ